MSSSSQHEQAWRPLAVAFDVNETLFSLAAVRRRLDALGFPPLALELWFARTLRDGIALAAAGSGDRFGAIAVDALLSVMDSSGREPDQKLAEEAVAAMEGMEPHPDVASCFAALREGGIRISTLTNGSGLMTERLLERAGLREMVERCFSVEEAGRWKPCREPYLHTAAELGVEPLRLALVAVHAWDVCGAKAAGLATGWASRLEGQFAPRFGRPDVTGADLVEVARGLLALAAPRG
ncbi:MAG: haloacid dehalogenase type II [Actinomycetota bacterium]|nr:haloacid dehalogenase type II [Actinomycetota bacterium]